MTVNDCYIHGEKLTDDLIKNHTGVAGGGELQLECKMNKTIFLKKNYIGGQHLNPLIILVPQEGR